MSTQRYRILIEWKSPIVIDNISKQVYNDTGKQDNKDITNERIQ